MGRRCRKYRQYPSEAHYQSHKPRDIHYLWQGDQLSQQQSHYADGRIVTTQWVYEPGTFRPLAQIRQLDTVNKAGELERGKPELHYAITDMAGNVKELCDPQGQVQWRSEQGLWQALYQWRLERSPKQYLEEAILDPLHCDLRHQGQIVDEETGLYYNRHRYYDPQICQYLSPDPIGLAGGTRPQAYVHNPLEWVDPLGLIGLNDKGWSLYHIMKGDKVVYVGITKDVKARIKQHERSGRLTDDYDLVEQKDNLTYAQARGYEQADIERFGTLDTSCAANVEGCRKHQY